MTMVMMHQALAFMPSCQHIMKSYDKSSSIHDINCADHSRNNQYVMIGEFWNYSYLACISFGDRVFKHFVEGKA